VNARTVTLALLAVAACSSGSKKVGSQPSWRGGGAGSAATKLAPVTFAPSSEPAARYNEPLLAPPRSPLGDAVLAVVRDVAITAKLPVPSADARLFRACAELAQVMPDTGHVDYSVVEFALQRHGIIEPSPYMLVVSGDIDEAEEIAEQLKSRITSGLESGSNMRVGVGAAKRNPDGTGFVVFALQASGVATAPIPRAVPAGADITIDAVVDVRYRDPELFVTRNNGQTEHLPIDVGKSGGFKARVACGKHVGRQQVEITASDASGSTVLANFPVWCGAQPPLSITIEPTHDDDLVVNAEDAEKRLLALMNRDRQAAGLQPLQWDDRVAAVSRAHSEDMRKTKIVAHISPTTGSAADRVRVANIKTAVVLENVARAYGVGEAHAGLMNSPGHRANMLASAATHVGIGVVLGDEEASRREMFLTQVLIRIPPKVEPAQVAEVVRQRIHAVRPVVVNAKLQGIAQEVAEGLAAGKSRDALWPTARKKLDAGNTLYARVSSVVLAVAELEAIDGKSLVGDYKPDDIGVGIAQGAHADIGEGAIWIVVLMADRLPAKKGSPGPRVTP
jgi:uncharacterized protein YkwD